MAEIASVIAFMLFAVAAATVLFVFVFMLLRAAETGLVALVTVFAASTALGDPGVTLGGIFVTPFDALAVLFAVVAAVRWAGQPITMQQLVWLGLGALICVSLLLGVSRFGLAAAGNEARSTELLYFWSCAAYFSSFRFHSVATERRGTVILAWGGAVIMIVVFVGWGLELSGVQIVQRFREPGASPFRVVPAAAAMFLLSVALVLLPKAIENGNRVLGALVGVFVLQVFLLQHRSVWFSAVLGLAVLVALYWHTIRRIAPYLPLAAVPVALAAAALLLKGALDGVIYAISFSVQNEGTLLWRIESWFALFTEWRNSGWAERSIGAPFGPGFSRYMESVGREIRTSPHNAYLTLLLRVGVAGLAAFVVIYVSCVRKLLAAKARRDATIGLAPSLAAVLAAQCVFFLFYGSNVMQALFLGSAMAVCAGTVAEPRRACSNWWENEELI